MENWVMPDEGEMGEWIPAPNGGHIGIIKGDDGGIYTASSDNVVNGSQVPLIKKGSRVRFTTKTFRDDDGDRITGTDMVTKEKYSTGAAREIELIP